VRAAVFQGPGNGLAVEQVPDPTPAERQLVVKVESCGICGTDLSLTSGHGFLQLQAGDVPGHEYSGEVVAVGSGVEQLSIGDRVSALAIFSCCGRCESCRSGNEAWCTGSDRVVGTANGFAEYALLGEPQAVKLRRDLSWDEGALVEPLAVGLHGVDLSDLRPGTDVVVIGAGPIALAAVYWARRRGAGRIVVAARSNRRERIARRLGATDFVAGENIGEALVERAGGPPRAVFEAAGVPGSLGLAFDVVAARGTVTVLGFCTEPDTLVWMNAVSKQVRAQFSFVYGSGDFEAVMQALANDREGPSAMVTKKASLDELPAVLENLRGPSTDCKVLIAPS
jgi:(R,R)-butanediol dehydrogenase/meso-butanediol dehydrogenase/diacetyl reductase